MKDEFGNGDAENADWEDRELCSDGNCIGVIGADGRCTECGRPGSGSRPRETPSTEDPEEAGEPASDTPPDVAGESPAGGGPGAAPEDDDWEERELCGDGNCIGVIGADGRCTECGQPAGGASRGPR